MAGIKHDVDHFVNISCDTRLPRRLTFHAMRVIDEALRRAKALGMGKADLARRLDISPQRLTNWIKRDLPASSFRMMAEALGCSLDELVGRSSLDLSGMERQLVELYRGCSPQHQEDLIAMAQRWHNHAHPEVSPANPFAKRKAGATP